MMKRLHILFFLVSFGTLVFTGILFYTESHPEWKTYQESYRKVLANQKSGGLVTDRETAIGIRQDWNPDLNLIDRCRTCHLGVNNEKAPSQQPINQHPDISPHKFSKLGCTTCHNGDGFATRLPDAHNNLLPMELVEGSCGKCHGSEIETVAPTLAAGDRLINLYNCQGCHQLEKTPDLATSAPDLSNIGGKVNRNWLENWLNHPGSYDGNTKMPDFMLTINEVQALSDYLMVVKEPSYLTTFLKAGNPKKSIDLESIDEDELDERLEKGRLSFSTSRCLTCHKLNGRGGDLAPELGRIALKTNRNWLKAWVSNPQRWNFITIMPRYNLPTEAVSNLVEYLIDESETDEPETAENKPVIQKHSAADQKGSEIRGRNLFTNKGCLNCHRMWGVEKTGNFASSLAEMADLDTDHLGFGDATIPKNKYDFITTKLQNPKLFGKDLIMPFYNLKPEEIGQITLALMGKSQKIPESYRVQPKIKDHHLPKGPVGELFDKYRCLSCHKVRGVGSDLAPDLTAEGSKVKKDWLKAYLRTPYAIRPYLTERMPRFNLIEAEADLLANYVSLALREENIDWLEVPKKNGDTVIGKQLYFEKFTCQSCHSIGSNGGYYGSALDTVGDRLTRKWTLARLENVHWYEDYAREPVLDLKLGETNNLAAFLQTLKQKGNKDGN
jgi:mono/diheme cytochrome c family protein